MLYFHLYAVTEPARLVWWVLVAWKAAAAVAYMGAHVYLFDFEGDGASEKRLSGGGRACGGGVCDQVGAK